MRTIGHHTCENNGTDEFILNSAPFLSSWIELPNVEQNRSKQKRPFLGTGYYYWDDNLEYAKWWGEKHYGNSYCIVESELELKGEEFLDLVGNRGHMKLLIELINNIQNSGAQIKADMSNGRVSLGKYIQLFKAFNNKKPGLFPFKVIRAVYHKIGNDIEKERFNYYFVDKGSKAIGYTLLSPRIIICFTDYQSVALRPKRLLERIKK